MSIAATSQPTSVQTGGTDSGLEPAAPVLRPPQSFPCCGQPPGNIRLPRSLHSANSFCIRSTASSSPLAPPAFDAASRDRRHNWLMSQSRWDGCITQNTRSTQRLAAVTLMH